MTSARAPRTNRELETVAMDDEPIHEKARITLDTATTLAFERTYLAHERTQMAWVHTALSLISFGFAIAKFFEMLHAKRGEQA